MQHLLKTYQKRLTNLTANNRSLFLLRLYSGQFVDVRDLHFLDHVPAFEIIRQLLARKSSIRLCSVLDSRDVHTNRISQQIKKLERNNTLIQQETGAQNLCIGYPFVVGKLLDQTPIRCPLLFFPLQLSVQDNHWTLQRRPDTHITFNKSFLLAFSHYNRIIFDDDFLEKDFEAFSKDSTEFLTELYHCLEESPLEIQFKPDQFEENLAFFTPDTKASFLEQHQEGRLHLEPQAVLGLFPQMDSYLAPDYDRLIHDSTTPDLSEFFAARQPQNPEAIKEEEIFTPYPFDASQESVIRQVRQGYSVVVQGPPGTGKSQMICNLAADFMARGKRVLIVCQKRAALEVVQERLTQKELAPFVALLHDFKGSRPAIFAQIAHQIEQLDTYKQLNNALDTIYLERNFLQHSRSIERCTELWQAFREALFDERACGASPKVLYLTSNPELPSIPLDKETFSTFYFHTYQEFLRTLRTYITYAIRLDKDSYVWQERVSFAGMSGQDLRNIQETLAQVGTFKEQVAQAVSQHIGQSISFDFCEKALSWQEEAQEMLNVLQNPTLFTYFHALLPHQGPDGSWIENKAQIINSCFENGGLEDTLPKSELAQAQEYIEAYRQAKKRFFKRNFFSKTKKQYVRQLLDKYSLTDDDTGLQALMQRLDNRMNLEHNLSQLQETEWVRGIPTSYAQEDFTRWLQAYAQALRAKRIFTMLQKVLDLLPIADLSFDTLKNHIHTLFGILNQIPQQKKHWYQYLHPRQVRWILEDNQNADKLKSSLLEDFDDLCAFDQIRDALRPVEQKVIAELKAYYGYFDAQKTIALFENSLRLAWLQHLEEEAPILRGISSLRLPQAEQELREALPEKYTLSGQMLLLKLREQTYQNVRYNRLRNRITYRDLEHQTNKKRGRWTLRRLMATFGEEVFQLIPCWLASPESVSAVFPMRQLFDLVIFDEASQCYAEKGLPAIYRGLQTVIVGDDQQLSPYNLYQPRWETEADDEDIRPELEVDSLLQLGKQYLPELALWGHYRSRHLSLIDFSNRHFYGQKLQIVPDFVPPEDQEPAIKYVRVDGIWHQNTNQSEVMEVVRQVKDLLLSGQKNIGVITFNFKQQEAIQDLLELTSFPLPDNFFVKNIENVQGDERDVIIFSIGYAPDAQGRLRSQFGLLNLQDGHHRLNVAISRARQKIIVVSSIWPHQLDVAETQHQGPKLLKAYLQYAHDVWEGSYQPALLPHRPQPKDWYLKTQLASENLTQSLPFADLSDKQSPRLIRTDDEQYYESLSVKDWHVHRPALLQSRGWQVLDLYSRNFWKNRAATEQAQKDFLA
ncbi:MAG: AAA domain-containing protein [Bernardetiaceae bacterium]